MIKRKIVAFVGAGYDNNEDLRWGNNQNFPASNDSTIIPVRNDPFTIARSSGTTADPYHAKGRGVYAIEIATLEQAGGSYYPDFANSGKRVWGYTQANNAAMKYSIPSDITTMDRNVDGFTEPLYVGDTGGQMWRFDVSAVDPATWTAKLIFQANPSKDNSGETVTTTGRKIFYRPAVASLDDHHTMVYFGTGDRAHPLIT